MAEFEWDPARAATNLVKHGVAFADVVMVFEDPDATTIEDPDPDEARYVTLGVDFLARVVVVVWTWRGDAIRIISARLATPQERRRHIQAHE